jgi:hypothetical protein
VVTASVAWYQWGLLRRQLENFEQAEAAHLEVTRIERSFINPDTGDLPIRLRIENFGRVSSPRQRVKVSAMLFRGGLTDRTETPVTSFAATRDIPPNRPRLAKEATLRLERNDVGRITQDRGQLLIVGMLEWDDGFGRQRTSGFCFQYRHPMQWERGCFGDYDVPEM